MGIRVGNKGGTDPKAIDRNIVGFLIFDGSWPEVQKLAAEKRVRELVTVLELEVNRVQKGELTVFLFGQGKLRLDPVHDSAFELFRSNEHGASVATSDRYVKVRIIDRGVTIASDYAGSIPIYSYSGGRFAVSNFLVLIEALVGVGSRDMDLEAAAILVKFGHQIGSESVWKHIQTLPPNREVSLSISSGDRLIPDACSSQVEFYDEPQKKTSLSLSLDELRQLNTYLVQSSLEHEEEIVLPLSSGFDSRLVLAAISEKNSLREKTTAVTYGSLNSIEVKAARELARIAGVRWAHVALPLNFLREHLLHKNWLIFGSGLHMHGMYQLEFLEALKMQDLIEGMTTFTSGFMTGVPTGQHTIRARKDEEGNLDRLRFLDSFPQSKLWTFEHLERVFRLEPGRLRHRAKKELEAVGPAQSKNHLKDSILLDIWTRQRQFVSYHPRVLSTTGNVVSPHMDPAWPSFFLAQPDSFLKRRKLIQKFFVRWYPAMAKIPSNSENFSAIGSLGGQLLRVADLMSQRHSLPRLVGPRFRDDQLDFDRPALMSNPVAAISPLPEYLAEFADTKELAPIVERATAGNLDDYLRLLSFQSIARSIRSTGSADEPTEG